MPITHPTKLQRLSFKERACLEKHWGRDREEPQSEAFAHFDGLNSARLSSASDCHGHTKAGPWGRAVSASHLALPFPPGLACVCPAWATANC